MPATFDRSEGAGQAAGRSREGLHGVTFGAAGGGRDSPQEGVQAAGSAPRPDLDSAAAARAGRDAPPEDAAAGEPPGKAVGEAAPEEGGEYAGSEAGGEGDRYAGYEYEEEDEEEEYEEAAGSPRIGRGLEARLDSILAASRGPERGARRGRVDDGFDGDKTVGEALDRPAILTLYGMIKSGVISRVNGPVSAGKESVVFWASGPGGEDVALKVYLVSTSSFKRRSAYILGDPRFGRIRRGTRSLVRLWAQKEFANLSACMRCGIPVPEPIRVAGTVLAMKFVGSGGRPHGTLLTTKDVCDADYRGTIALIGRLYAEARLVHADLSAYNVFKAPGGRLVLFDLGSAVDARHPRAAEFLERDIRNVSRFFARRGLSVDNPADVLEEVTAGR